MQKYEFCRMSIYHKLLIRFTPGGQQGRRIEQDGRMGDRTDVDACFRAMAQLGLEGWQLVTVVNDEANPGNKYFYFQRPILDEQ